MQSQPHLTVILTHSSFFLNLFVSLCPNQKIVKKTSSKKLKVLPCHRIKSSVSFSTFGLFIFLS
ncbi:MAG: hypothetical protein CMH78_03705 [Nitrospinae bacterium]|nr:hypothetical protein [Nitrospinota bacterium]